jgi:hypothetical protein
MFQCIGQRRTQHEGLVRCSHTSEIPTGKWNEFLCSDCANARPNARPQFIPEIADRDKPNFDEDDVEFFPARASQESQDREDFDRLEELDLD